MNTEHKAELKKRHEQDNKKYTILIQNEEIADNGLKVIVTSKYENIEEALHKIELDLMTNLHFNFENPIKIKIVQV